ncbi:MAG: DUF4391 domain-containing protein [Clostridia bacterium]|nr:DUF4391 domain-containing protein [Clostridia bacterium]
MFGLSSKTQVSQVLKIPFLFKEIKADKQVKENASNVLSVTVTNVINKDTMNIAQKDDKVKNIYVIVIELNGKVIPNLFIAALDKKFAVQTLFVLNCKEQYMAYGAFKEYSEKGMRIDKYYCSEWLDDLTIQLPLTAVSMSEIYRSVLSTIIPIKPRDKESARDYALRYGEVLRLQKEIDKLQRAVDNEKQSKKRFELNAELKDLKKELEILYE